jgi:hypothetical protein
VVVSSLSRVQMATGRTFLGSQEARPIRERKRPVGFGLFKHLFLKGLILAQNERWRRGLGMQVERIPFG